MDKDIIYNDINELGEIYELNYSDLKKGEYYKRIYEEEIKRYLNNNSFIFNINFKIPIKDINLKDKVFENCSFINLENKNSEIIFENCVLENIIFNYCIFNNENNNYSFEDISVNCKIISCVINNSNLYNKGAEKIFVYKDYIKSDLNTVYEFQKQIIEGKNYYFNKTINLSDNSINYLVNIVYTLCEFFKIIKPSFINKNGSIDRNFYSFLQNNSSESDIPIFILYYIYEHIEKEEENNELLNFILALKNYKKEVIIYYFIEVISNSLSYYYTNKFDKYKNIFKKKFSPSGLNFSFNPLLIKSNPYSNYVINPALFKTINPDSRNVKELLKSFNNLFIARVGKNVYLFDNKNYEKEYLKYRMEEYGRQKFMKEQISNIIYPFYFLNILFTFVNINNKIAILVLNDFLTIVINEITINKITDNNINYLQNIINTIIKGLVDFSLNYNVDYLLIPADDLYNYKILNNLKYLITNVSSNFVSDLTFNFTKYLLIKIK